MGWSGQSMRSRFNQPSSSDLAGRNQLIKAVHSAVRGKGIDEELRRGIQYEVTGKYSLKDMTVPEIRAVLDKINGKQSTAATPHRPWIGKIRALWWTLYWLGEIEHSGDKTIDSFVKRQGGVIALRFLDHRGAPAVIEALKAWARRAGVEWPAVDNARASRLAVLRCVSAKFEIRYPDRRAKSISQYYLNHTKPETEWSDKEIDLMISHIGEEIRRNKLWPSDAD